MPDATKVSRSEERRRAAALCAHLRLVEGLSVEEIALRVGRRPATIRGYLHDPDGVKARARKERYRGACEVCGAPTSGGDGPGRAHARCRRCSAAPRRRWDRGAVLAAMASWEARYGAAPTSYDWNATLARGRGAAGRRLRNGDWPTASTVTALFGGWGNARAAYSSA